MLCSHGAMYTCLQDRQNKIKMAAVMVCALQSAEPWSAVFTLPLIPRNQGRKGDWGYLVLYLHLLDFLDVKSVHLMLTPCRGGHVGGSHVYEGSSADVTGPAHEMPVSMLCNHQVLCTRADVTRRILTSTFTEFPDRKSVV